MEHDWQLIGYMYYFMVSLVNLVETKSDESPIIDNKGVIVGKMQYAMNMEIMDPHSKKPLNLLKYNSLTDLIGKRLKVILELKKATNIQPEKLAYEVQSKYQWLDESRTEYLTNAVKGEEGKAALGYRAEHEIEVDEDLVSYMVENTLTIGVYGKVEPKKKAAAVDKEKGLEVIPEEEEFNHMDKGDNTPTNVKKGEPGTKDEEVRMSKDREAEFVKLKKEKEELEKELKKLRETKSVLKVQQSGCCLIY